MLNYPAKKRLILVLYSMIKPVSRLSEKINYETSTSSSVYGY
jgi:hypothetical protein